MTVGAVLSIGVKRLRQRRIDARPSPDYIRASADDGALADDNFGPG
jgi:hypothetical protein